jgi:hypothetical protein
MALEQQARTACSGLSFTRVITGLNFFPSVMEFTSLFPMRDYRFPAGR